MELLLFFFLSFFFLTLFWAGISEENFADIARKHRTSKIREFDDLQSISTFGFRGEALAALANIAVLSMTTRTEDMEVGFRLDFDSSGEVCSKSMFPREHGTTVTVTDVFKNLPVRKEDFSRNIKREYGKLLPLVQAYALICSNVKISLYNVTTGQKKQLVLSSSGTNDMRENIVLLFGAAETKDLVPISFRFPLDGGDGKSSFLCEGFATGPNSASHGRRAKDKQFLFFNKRPVDLPAFSKVLNECFRMSPSNQGRYPVAILSMTLEHEGEGGGVDVNVTPDKRKIFLAQESEILEGFRKEMTLHMQRLISESVPYVENAASQSVQVMPVSTRRSPGSLSSSSSSSPFVSRQASQESMVQQPALLVQTTLPTVVVPKPAPVFVIEEEEEEEKDDVVVEKQKSCCNHGESAPPSLSKGDTVPAATNIRDFFGAFSFGNKNNTSSAPTTTTTVTPPRNNVTTPVAMSRDVEVLVEDEAPVSSVKRETVVSVPITPTALGSRTPSSGSLVLKTLSKMFEERAVKEEVIKLSDDSVMVKEALLKVNEDVGDDDDEVVFLGYGNSSVSVKTEGERKMVHFDLDEVRQQLRSKRSREEFDPQSAGDVSEESGSKTFRREDFKRLEVIGQFNNGFIITRRGKSDLFIVDQHASNEIFNFEMLQKSTRLHSQPLLQPMVLTFSPEEEMIVASNMRVFEDNGFFLEFDDEQPCGRKVRLLGRPESKDVVFGEQDVRELVDLIRQRQSGGGASGGGMLRPSRVRSMFASRACRMSVMIGTPLSRDEMTKIVRDLATLNAPWNCPHGRPTFQHLMNLEK